MEIPLSKCPFHVSLQHGDRRSHALSRHPDNLAVASTDAGHNGSSADGTFAINGPQTQIDFGYRAVHLTTVYAKKIVKVRCLSRP